MNPAYISALAALSGSAIGALASFATTWTTQNFQNRSQVVAQTAARRERLYTDFIDETSRLLADAIVSSVQDASKFVTLYAIRSKLVLFAPSAVVDQVDEVVRRLVEIYAEDTSIVAIARVSDRSRFDILAGFANACPSPVALFAGRLLKVRRLRGHVPSAARRARRRCDRARRVD